MLTSRMAILRAAASGQAIIVPTEMNYLRGYLVGYDETTITLLACMKASATEGEPSRLLWNAAVIPRTHMMIFTKGLLKDEEDSVQELHATLAGKDFALNCKNKVISQLPDLP